ncbi:MAG: PAS domain S-box protein, partial [Campylobacteraceae bacterium]|nr:PAS domain S-box protein [Campylobacteraceae bacterium]MBT6389597.1 PAS domain S-box protein [Campylobacteraceae bacterium]MBT6578430.1 PAS domain S-box protein [Campylobacteraceae bacterium]
YKHAIEASNIVSKTDVYGIITFVNEEFCNISGYTQEELIGANHNIVRHPDVPEENFVKLWDVICRKKTYTNTVKNLAKDGSTFYVNTTITPILDENDEIVEYIAIRYDVTSQMELKFKLEAKEKELEDLNKKLEEKVILKTKEIEDLNIVFHQARLASMGQMIANIAHQWRQPLTSLNLALFNIKKEAKKGNIDIVEAMYNNTKNTIKNMSETLENFTDFFKPNKIKTKFSVKNSINESISLLGKTILDEHISIKTNIEDAKLTGVSNELTQVFINLIQNSKDAFISNKISNRIILLTIKQDNNILIIDFKDNAGGITTDIIESIFEPYFTTKHQYQGTGLGLFMSKMICEQSFDGNISVNSQDNTTVFRIELPIKE